MMQWVMLRLRTYNATRRRRWCHGAVESMTVVYRGGFVAVSVDVGAEMVIHGEATKVEMGLS